MEHPGNCQWSGGCNSSL